MENAIYYYYNIVPRNIHQLKDNYQFEYQNYKYLFTAYNRRLEDIDSLVNLSQYLMMNNIFCHEFVVNRERKFITVFDNKYYVLLRINIQNNRIIDIDDIINFNIYIPYHRNLKNIVRSDWISLWTSKLDYFEYQISHLVKEYPLLLESISYYLGLGENAISYLINNKVSGNTLNLCVSHRRINYNDTLLEFLNPVNFIIDYRVRDISEYLKSLFVNEVLKLEMIDDYFEKVKLEAFEYFLFYSRMLLPTFYYDKYEDIVNNNRDEKEILPILQTVKKYENLLQEIFFMLKNRANLVKIDWLNNKNS